MKMNRFFAAAVLALAAVAGFSSCAKDTEEDKKLVEPKVMFATDELGRHEVKEYDGKKDIYIFVTVDESTKLNKDKTDAKFFEGETSKKNAEVKWKSGQKKHEYMAVIKAAELLTGANFSLRVEAQDKEGNIGHGKLMYKGAEASNPAEGKKFKKVLGDHKLYNAYSKKADAGGFDLEQMKSVKASAAGWSFVSKVASNDAPKGMGTMFTSDKISMTKDQHRTYEVKGSAYKFVELDGATEAKILAMTEAETHGKWMGGSKAVKEGSFGKTYLISKGTGAKGDVFYIVTFAVPAGAGLDQYSALTIYKMEL